METPQGICARCGWTITPRWIYLLTILLWSTDAIATGTLFDVYINDLARKQGFPHPNEFIGIMESSRGITCLVVAVPLGYLFDRFDRLRVLRCAVICFGLTGALLLSARSLDQHGLSVVVSACQNSGLAWLRTRDGGISYWTFGCPRYKWIFDDL